MTTIFGALGVNDYEYVFNATQGQRAIYDLIVAYVAQIQSDLAGQARLFIEETTENFKERYKLPGGGRMQKLGRGVVPGVVKRYGGWDVGYKLEDFAAGMAIDDVSRAYMTAEELQRHIDTVITQNINSERFEILYHLFNNNQKTFADEDWGSITVEPLANGDTVTYPPVLGSESVATEDHYLESGYAASSISDTNNPYVTIRDELEHHYGTASGGEQIIALINSDQTAKTQDLTDFVEYTDYGIVPGTQTATLVNTPPVPGTARILGRTNGVWVAQWAWIPSGYILATHFGMPAPLKRRVDPRDTGLPVGLTLVYEDMDYPMNRSYWRNRQGFGVGNRLNGVVMELGTGGTYTIPTAYQ